MKTLQGRIQQAAKDSGVSQLVVERDYAQSYVLFGIASQAGLRDALVFKGGTSLSKAFGAIRRFSVPRSSNSLESRPPASGRSRSTPQTPRQSTSIIPRRYPQPNMRAWPTSRHA